MSEVKGMRELTKALKAFPDNIQKNILTSAVRAGAATIQKEAKRQVPFKTGALKKAIAIKKMKTRDKTSLKFRIGIKRNSKEDAYYGHIIEFGSSKMAAQPFMRPALELKASEVMSDIKKQMIKRIDKEIEKSKR